MRSSILKLSPITRAPSIKRIHPLYTSQSNTASLTSVTVTNSRPDAEGFKVIDVLVTPEHVSAYRTPGQFVQIKVSTNNPSLYAIASPPSGDNVFTFLVKENESNRQLVSVTPGSSLLMSLPQGDGFNINQFNSNESPIDNIIMMATGSGLAPIVSLIESNAFQLMSKSSSSESRPKVTLFIGARSMDHVPLRRKLWDINYVPVLSKPKSVEDFFYRTGYVQHALESSDLLERPECTGAILCGHSGMIEDVKDILIKAGVKEDNILLNFKMRSIKKN